MSARLITMPMARRRIGSFSGAFVVLNHRPWMPSVGGNQTL
jgi:hypothetical protein